MANPACILLRTPAEYKPGGDNPIVKKGQEQVSAMDSPRQGEKRDPKDPKIKHKGEGSRSQTRAKPQAEGSGSDGS
jgi:hypothetical protein